MGEGSGGSGWACGGGIGAAPWGEASAGSVELKAVDVTRHRSSLTRQTVTEARDGQAKYGRGEFAEISRLIDCDLKRASSRALNNRRTVVLEKLQLPQQAPHDM